MINYKDFANYKIIYNGGKFDFTLESIKKVPHEDACTVRLIIAKNESIYPGRVLYLDQSFNTWAGKLEIFTNILNCYIKDFYFD